MRVFRHHWVPSQPPLSGYGGEGVRDGTGCSGGHGGVGGGGGGVLEELCSE